MYYLLKTEPTVYGFADLQKEQSTIWDGVTNPVAVKNLRGMSKGDKLTNHLALSMLGECGIAAIWRLNVAAADAHRSGHPCAAAVILQIAEAAEEAWLRAEGARSVLCCSKSS